MVGNLGGLAWAPALLVQYLLNIEADCLGGPQWCSDCVAVHQLQASSLSNRPHSTSKTHLSWANAGLRFVCTCPAGFATDPGNSTNCVRQVSLAA